MSLVISTPASSLPSSTSPFSQGSGAYYHPLPRTSQPAQDVTSCAGESGRRAPPVEGMSTAYQPSLAALESHALPRHSHSMGHAGRTNMAVGEPGNPQMYRLMTKPQEQLFPAYSRPEEEHHIQEQGRFASADVNGIPRPMAETTAASQHSTRPSTPTSDRALAVPKDGSSSSRRGSDSLVYHSLTTPRCISPSGGNLAELAAQMTCLFWFESADQLKQAERFRSGQPNGVVSRLPALARPDAQFRKWVLSVLSTTQVTQNVILLALLFIYRLKMSTPQIKGREGSEYRLLIVALMLGNKFLDDNTYTNKTWAEVSSFQVKEIHVMEVEFLSNMRYNLLASKKEWEEWIEKLSCFHEYYEQAQRIPASPVHAISPDFSSPFPSPTGTRPPMLPEMPSVTPTKMTNLPPSRKRSLEDGYASDHPAKRVVPSVRLPVSATPQGGHMPASTRLPGPLSIITNQAHNLPPPQTPSQMAPSFSTPNTYIPPVVQVPTQVSLPPLQHGTRAMSTVYQQPSQPPLPVQQPPSAGMAPTLPSTSFPGPILPTQTPVGYGTATKRHSPGSLAPFTSSPMADHFGPGSMIHTPIANSPSVYLQHRNSPYRPIRHVNTLLYPPPSASLDQYHLGVPLPPAQMHYQPLGRRHDVRTGVVPEFVIYNRGQHQPLPPQMTPHGHFTN